MATPAEVSSRLVRALSIAEPELDVSPGTPIRKIVDTVGEAIAELTVDSFMTTYQYDIDTRSGADLDAFAALFGFYRLQAQRSSGTILLQRTTPAPDSILIPPGSQASTGGSSPVLVRTLVPALFARGTVVLEIPVEVIDGGSNGDLAAGSITRWLTTIEGITSITNPAPLVGGADVETDEQFRDRLKKTIFRNLAGTKDMYLGVALGEKNTSAAEVYGPYERWTERIEIIGGVGYPSIATPPGSITFVNSSVDAGGIISTGIPHRFNNGDYVYITAMSGTGNAALYVGLKQIHEVRSHDTFIVRDTDGGIITPSGNTGSGSCYLVSRESGANSVGFAFGRDIDFNDIFPKSLYSVNVDAVPPIVTVLDSQTIPDGVYEFSFIYSTQGSRNHPFRTQGIISDRIDVWIDGTTIEEAHVVAVLDSNNVLDWDATEYAIGGYRRRDGSRPNESENSIIMPLPLVPIIDVPDTISMGSETYEEGTDYFVVDRVIHDIQGSMESGSGIEFVTARSSGAGTVPHTETITGGTNATPVVLTIGAHNFKVGQRIKVQGYGEPEINGDWYLSAVSGTTVTLQDSLAPGGTSNTGTVQLFHPISLDYTFNLAPLTVQRDIEEWRLAGTDVLVHKARTLPLKIFFAVILQSGYTAQSVVASVESALRVVLAASGIGGVLQISDMLTAVGQVAGIDSVRMLSAADRPTITITNIVTSSDDATVTTATNHNFQVGEMVDIVGVAGATSMNNVWRIKSIGGATSFVAEYGWLNSAYTSAGTVRSGDYAIQVMSQDGTKPLNLVADRSQVPSRAIDVHANDTEQFVLHGVELVVKAQSSWGIN